jgi:hypothetical protein
MLCISGVSAEEIDVNPSVVAECPISAELDNSLSSCDASYSELSTYELDCEGFKHSSESIDSPDEVCYEYESFDYSYDQISFEPSDSFESYNAYIPCGYVELSDCYDSQIPCESLGLDDFRPISTYDSLVSESYDDVYYVGDINPILGAIDNDVIVDDCDVCFENQNIVVMATNCFDIKSNSKSLTRYVELKNNSDSKISGVTNDMEASQSNNFSINVGPQVNDLLRFESDCNVLDIFTLDLQEISETGEPVFDCILVTSGYVSYNEAYFGTISDSDREMLLRYVGADDLIMFASSAIEWNSGVTFDILKNVTLNQQIDEINLAGYKIAKALLKYYPSTDEIHISLVSSDNEDEQSHVINDTNSHGLDYAYIKHVNVIYKDMPNLMVLTSSGDVSNNEKTEGSWDSLNDVLGYSMSSETLLPDHKAIWTPLLLLLQQDLQESIVNSHADDNRNKITNKAKTNATDNNSTNNTNCSNKTHHKGRIHHYKHWGHNCNGYTPWYCGFISRGAVDIADLNKNNKNDNSTDDKNKSGNATASTNKGKSSGSPKSTPPESEPTYTLVYAIIGIAIVCVLFNSGYMKRDD